MSNEEMVNELVAKHVKRIAELVEENKSLRDKVHRLEADVKYLQKEIDHLSWNMGMPA